jgi:hypothetical protein
MGCLIRRLHQQPDCEFPWACGPPMEMKAAFSRPIDSKWVKARLSRECNGDIQQLHLLVQPDLTGGVEVNEGQSFQDGTRLTVRVSKPDNDRVQFSVIEDREVAGLGAMSYPVFVNRFT